MKLHTDLKLRVSANTNDMPWVPSPVSGIDRKMLERDGDEIARATSLVRYAPHSSFTPHQHELGEEFLVLDGVFQDELGCYPAGTYV
jgi:anti-sigma factor ChrR (cupin superfamily)